MISHYRSTPRLQPRVLSSAIAVLFVSGLASPSTRAANLWDGGGANGNWSTGLNWDNDLVPLFPQPLTFAGAAQLTNSNDLTGVAVHGVTFTAGAGAFTVGGNGVTLTNGLAGGGGTVAGGNITNNSTSVEALTLPLTLSVGNHTIVTGAGSGSLNLNGAFNRAADATVVFTRNGGNINFSSSGLANDVSGILGGWAVIGNDWASLDGSGNVVGYGGYTPIAAGAITGGANLNYKYSGDTAALTAADGTIINSFLATISAARTLTISGTMKLGSNGGIYRTGGSTANSVMTIAGGTLTANGGGEITLSCATNTAANFAATNNNLLVTSVIADEGANKVAVNVLGYVQMNAANTYTGNTYVNQGRASGNNIRSYGSGDVYVYPGAQAFLNNNGTFTNNFIIFGIGPTEQSGGQNLGAIRMNTGATTISGTITLADNARISGGSGASNTIVGRITGPGRLEFTAATGNNVGITLNNPANDWSGGLLITVGGGTRRVNLKLGASDQIPDGPGRGDVTLNGTNDVATLDLNGFDETINGLSGGNSVNNQVTNLGAAPSVLTVGNNNATATFGGILQDGGVNFLSLVKIGSGTQTLGGANNYNGTTTINGGRLDVTNSLAATSTVLVNNTGVLGGSGTVNGPVLVTNGGGLAGGVSGSGTLTLPGGVTIGATATDTATISVTANAVPGIINIAGALAVNSGPNTVTINVGGAAPALGQYVLIDAIDPLSAAAFSAFKLGPVAGRVVANLVNNTDNASVDLNVTGTGDFPLWTGTLSSQWSTGTLSSPKNWVLNSNNATTTDYIEADNVLFTDAATNTTVDISGANVSPGAVSFNNTTKNYTLTGSAAIVGSATLTKDGTGTVTIANNNSFGGAVTINAGTVQIGNGGTAGSLGTGVVQNEAALVFNRSDAVTAGNVINGAGSVEKIGAGVLTLSGSSGYMGTTTISSGTVKVTNAAGGNSSLGALGGGTVTVTPGATLDLSGNLTANGLNFGAKQFYIAGSGTGGAGVIVNNGVSQLNALQHVTLTADATIGTAQRIDIRSQPTTSLNASLDLAGHTLTKTGANQFSLVGVDVMDGNILVNQGTFSIETVSSVPDFGTGKTITFNAGTIAQFFSNTAAVSTVLRPMVFNGSGIQIGSASNNNNSTIGSPMTLNGDVTFAALNNATATSTLTLTGNITETGGARSITKTGPSALVLTGTNAWTGPTHLQGGTLRVGSAGALPTTTDLNFSGGALDLNDGVTSFDQTVKSIAGTAGTITNSDFGNVRTLVVNQATDTLFAGTVSGNLTLLKAGAGALTLSGPQSYVALFAGAGTTTLTTSLPNATITNNAGTLNINADAANSTVIANAVTNFGSSQTLASLEIGAGGVVTLTAQAPGGLPEFATAAEPLAPTETSFAAGPAQAVPEPGALALLAVGLLGLFGRRRRTA